MKLSIKGMASAASDGLEGHVRRIFDNQSARVVFVGELEHVQRVEPGPASTVEPSVSVRLSRLEVPSQGQQEEIRELLRALYLIRTAPGTLDEASGAVSLEGAAQKVSDAVSVTYVQEALDARVVLRHVHNALADMISPGQMDVVKIRRRAKKVHTALSRFLAEGAAVESLLPEFLPPIDSDEAAAAAGVEVDAEVRA